MINRRWKSFKSAMPYGTMTANSVSCSDIGLPELHSNHAAMASSHLHLRATARSAVQVCHCPHLKTIMRDSLLENRPTAWRDPRVWILGVLFTLGTALILVVPLLAAGRIDLNEGEVAREDIRAPRSLTYESDVLTNQARAEAEQNVPTQYDPLDPRVAWQQIARV